MLHVDISFHESRTIALSDLCKLMLPAVPNAELWIDRVALSKSVDLPEVDIAIYLEHDSGTVPLSTYKVVTQCEIDIPQEFRNIAKHHWVYLRLETAKGSVLTCTESPHEFVLYVNATYSKRENQG
jgi:hypothetical protein